MRLPVFGVRIAVLSKDGDPLDAYRLEFKPVRAEGREFATAAGTGGLVPGEGSLYKDIGALRQH